MIRQVTFFICLTLILFLGEGKYFIIQTKDTINSKDDAKDVAQDKGEDYQNDYNTHLHYPPLSHVQVGIYPIHGMTRYPKQKNSNLGYGGGYGYGYGGYGSGYTDLGKPALKTTPRPKHNIQKPRRITRILG